jgi:hypothetical protein
MNEKVKLILALQQIESLTSLLEGNEYHHFLYGHIVQMRTELKRQVSHYE